MSKKYNKKSPVTKNKNVKPITEKHSGMKRRPALNISFLHFIPLCFSLIIFSILWFKPFNVNLKDPWFEGAVLIDSARNVNDTNQTKLLLDEGGKKLAEQVRLHPYHARVHYLYGYYWFMLQNWDSVIYQEKEAIRIGAGGIVNQVEYKAQEMLNLALDNKVIPLINMGKYDDALAALENAKTPNMMNPGIDKNKGIIFSRQGNSDSALTYFISYKQSNPNDATNLANIGISYLQKNNRDSARKYINDALKIDPNNATAKQVNAQISQ